MANKRLNAIITIGGAIAGTFKTAMRGTKGELVEIGRAIRSLNDRQKRLGAVADHWEKMGRDAGRFRKEIEVTNAEMTKLRKTQTRLHEISKAQSRNMARRKDYRGQMLDAVAIGVTMAAPVRAAMRFESAMADVKKVLPDDLDVAAIKALETGIMNMSLRIPMAGADLAKIVASGGQAGLASSELLRFAEDAAKMGVAFDITADEAGDLMAKWRAAFRMNQNQVVRLADQINHLGNTTAATAPLISDVVRTIGPLGDIGGIAASSIAALGATMIGAGVDTSVAATGIKNLILSMTAGEAATAKQSKAFQMLGFDAEEMAEFIQEDAETAILSVMEALQDLDKTEQASVLNQLVGRQAIGALSPLLTNLDSLRENLIKVGDAAQYTGSMQKEFAARSATTENNLQLLGNQITRLGVNVGVVLLPALNSIVGTIGAGIQVVANLASVYPGLTKAIVGTVVVLGGLKIAAVAVGYAWTFVTGGWLALSSLLVRAPGILMALTAGLGKVTFAVRAIGMALMANPIGLIIGGIALAAGLIYTYWEPISSFFSDLFGDIEGTLAGAFDFIKTIFSFSPIGLIMRAWQPALDWIADKVGWIGDVVKPVANFLGLGGKTDDGAVAGPQPTAPVLGSAVTVADDYLAIGRHAQAMEAPRPAPDAIASALRGTSPTAEQAGNSTFNITVNAAPGQDARSLADEVWRLIQRKQAQSARGELYDAAMAY